VPVDSPEMSPCGCVKKLSQLFGAENIRGGDTLVRSPQRALFGFGGDVPHLFSAESKWGGKH
jgi:hypothetical protein